MNTILWDFDGVILDSMAIRDWGFRKIFNSFTNEEVDRLITFHSNNGGLSRYVKIRYFYEEILGMSITEEEVLLYANEFSKLMRKELVNPENLIQDSVDFIKQNFNKYCFHIVSGSDQEELRFLCKELGIDSYFISIHGSPTPKKQLVSMLLEKQSYNKSQTCLIGDSINDYEAAEFNNITFYGYNNFELKKLKHKYIDNFISLEGI
ncbi:HAD-IA family hydrolase [Flavivirga amylovorans]|uniref:phosphoglycolate phosphatase n=1 Tax=Flavivirga amylovorans TaxID=870486 RepID=A0ABT8X6G7_9FLAO|nr:HAD-IA family hydrolase [Flavivirga amylovorans]MDO5989272.1 HAD-IA family hydrolase [Flavivirga amylovorans]